MANIKILTDKDLEKECSINLNQYPYVVNKVEQ